MMSRSRWWHRARRVQRVERAVQRVLLDAGWDVRRADRHPRRRWLGLASLPIRTVIDVGAFTGAFSVSALRRFPHARAFAFEPLPSVFADLERRAIGTDGRLRPFPLAIGSSSGHADMFLQRGWPRGSSFLRASAHGRVVSPRWTGEERVRVEVASLDEATAELPLIADVLVSVNVLGFERAIFEGGSRCLRASRALILHTPLEPVYEGQADFADSVATLAEHGLSYRGNLEQEYLGDGAVVSIRAVFTR